MIARLMRKNDFSFVGALFTMYLGKGFMYNAKKKKENKKQGEARAFSLKVTTTLFSLSCRKFLVRGRLFPWLMLSATRAGCFI